MQDDSGNQGGGTLHPLIAIIGFSFEFPQYATDSTAVLCGRHLPYGLCSIPTALRLDGVSLFDSSDFGASIRVPTYVADKLWDGGFRNVTGFDKDGLNPMLHSWYAANFDMVSWLLGKRAPLLSQHRDVPMCGLHLYAYRLSNPGEFFHNDHHSVPSPSRELTRQFWHNPDAIRDCSNVEDDAELLRTLWAKTHVPLELRQTRVEGFLRLAVFDMLRCSHTCCYVDFGGHVCERADYLPNYRPKEPDIVFYEKLGCCLEKMARCECRGADKVPCVVGERETCRSVRGM
ncbi:uncharacterized protein F4812DRAFT_467430 [Daldinia caldariorum]|uniref:uncharacterized protein n=1 Tax=Daldinia caldariorum TaxID=326644 RepID=UPI002008909D|nr:uncharacterized protein F4812DRAFT_467430 [Daldinia caldariorum]KAI1471288.1 hypothetical protein F4812DRAFT_467430 [Daldinia caldariorum]